jgi:dienelactone hydrolase
MATCVLGAPSTGAADARETGLPDYRQETVTAMVPVTTSASSLPARKVRITGLLYVPAAQSGKAPPLAIFSHGSQGAGGEGTYDFPARHFRPFLERGYAVFIPIRKGFNKNGTPPSAVSAAQTEPLSCRDTRTSYEESIRSVLDDSNALLNALKEARKTDLDFTNVTLAGHSRGGFISVAWAAEGVPGVRQVVNFSGGWQGDCPEFTASKFEEFAKRVKVPIISLYGNHDSAWQRRSIDQFIASLGKARKATGHVVQGTGHSLFETSPDRWVPLVFPGSAARVAPSIPPLASLP